MFIKKIIVGPLESNCYLFGDEATKEIFVIDPGGDYREIKSVIDKNGMKPKAVINTHGHGDHIGANKEFGIPVWIHRLDADFLMDPSKNLSGAFGFFLKTKTASRLVEDKDILNIGKYSLEVIHTPGHTPGSICLKAESVIFTGDTLFCEGIGRTDFAYGSEEDIMDSIKEKLFTLKDDYVIYPGHGPSSTIGNEKTSNPFVI
ncbi:MAG: MBL fold metallo-hydrolase [Candidatus Omnitrophica bacterium CG_4_9_14_0_2_um_filter_42_8]|nr:MAG: MBL fold metallo-hydrolase [Candidatus Omnitrophica bacterium CG22_combo_CG10-13_8_21_14_all_43_16]PJC48453.1 MAG: MBL fold metallo-hydrolase [Candidatus Omnitrophica bacterium CG_4_9_14_0_2_um_filter_42_8]